MSYQAEHKVTCEKCGSVWQLYSAHIPMRDSDSLHCCGIELISWNGAEMWRKELLKPGQITGVTESNTLKNL